VRDEGRYKAQVSALVAIASLGLSACAYVTAVPAPPDEYVDGVRVKSHVEGVRIPDCKPLIAVTGNAINVIWIKNPDKELALRFGTFLAKHEFGVEFTNQCLSKLTSNQDTTAVPIAFINLLSKALETGRPIGQAFSDKANDAVAGVIQLYDPVFDGNGTLLYLKPLIHKRDLQVIPQLKAGAPQTAVTSQVNTKQNPSTPGGKQKTDAN
jgi:hypothetical protein